MQEKPLILTLRIDEESQSFFNARRKLYFPPERNFLDAHLTLFHQLPEDAAGYLVELKQHRFDLQVTRLMSLGAGVAYCLESQTLQGLHQKLSVAFNDVLIPQDRQPFRPHVTIQNKVTPEQARRLLAQLNEKFKPFAVTANGIDLWTYLGGPWRHEQNFAFQDTDL